MLRPLNRPDGNSLILLFIMYSKLMWTPWLNMPLGSFTSPLPLKEMTSLGCARETRRRPLQPFARHAAFFPTGAAWARSRRQSQQDAGAGAGNQHRGTVRVHFATGRRFHPEEEIGGERRKLRVAAHLEKERLRVDEELGRECFKFGVADDLVEEQAGEGGKERERKERKQARAHV